MMNFLRFLTHLTQTLWTAVQVAWNHRDQVGFIDVVVTYPLPCSPTGEQLAAGRSVLMDSVAAGFAATGVSTKERA